MKSDFLIALTQLAAERHLPREQVLQAIEAALASAFKKDSVMVGQNISVKLNPNNTADPVKVFALKTVVEDVEDSQREIDLKDAQKIKKDAIVGEEVPVEPLHLEFSRIAAQTAKQVVLQRLREVERDLIFQEFAQRINDVISGVVEQMESGRMLVMDMGRAQAVLPPDEQVMTERYRKGQRLKVYVLDVRRSPKGPEILVSRSHKNLLKRLFEIEVPEVFNGIVEIKSTAREAGSRSKVAVASRQDGIDPVGSCIGMRGNRIQSIVNELQGEKIDVVRWDKDPKALISNALSPSEVVHVEVDEDTQSALVVVPERQLSLAIGKEGQNARLAAKLTNFRLDIKSMSEWEGIKVQRQAEEEDARRSAAKAQQEELELAELEAEILALEAESAKAEAVEAVAEEVEAPVPQDQMPVPEDGEALEPVPVAEVVVSENAGDVSPEEELALIALKEDEAELEEEDDEELVEEDAEAEDTWKVPVLSTGAGQIRFAEDIMGDFRSRGRRDRRGNRGGQDNGAKGKRGAGPSRGPRTRSDTGSPNQAR